jgi:short-subunit dehydrogenase
VGSVQIVIVPSITGFQTGKNLSVYVATVLFLVLQADGVDKQQMVSDSFKVRHPVVFSYN